MLYTCRSIVTRPQIIMHIRLAGNISIFLAVSLERVLIMQLMYIFVYCCFLVVTQVLHFGNHKFTFFYVSTFVCEAHPLDLDLMCASKQRGHNFVMFFKRIQETIVMTKFQQVVQLKRDPPCAYCNYSANILVICNKLSCLTKIIQVWEHQKYFACTFSFIIKLYFNHVQIGRIILSKLKFPISNHLVRRALHRFLSTTITE